METFSLTLFIYKHRILFTIALVLAVLIIPYTIYFSNLPPTRDQAKAYLVQLRKELQLPASEQVVFDQVYDGGCGPDQTSWLHNRIVCIYNLAYYVKGEEKSPEGFENAKKDLFNIEGRLNRMKWQGDASVTSGHIAEYTNEYSYALYSDVLSPANSPLTLHLEYFKGTDNRYKDQDGVNGYLGLGTHIDLKTSEYVYGISTAVAYRQNQFY